MADDGGLLAVVTQVVEQHGTRYFQALATTLSDKESNDKLPTCAGGLTGPEWLAFCRHRITELIGHESDSL